MSFRRTALRLATVLALSNNSTAPYPTAAGRYVFDTRFDPQQLTEDVERTPIINVYTDRDQGDPKSPHEKNGRYFRTIDLMIELAVCQVVRRDAEGNEIPAQHLMVQTDAELEALLDLMEIQVRSQLMDPNNVWSRIWRDMLIRVISFDSDRYVEDDMAEVRFAIRCLTLECVVPDDCPPDVIVLAKGQSAPPIADQSIGKPIADLVAAVAGAGASSPYVDQVVAVLRQFQAAAPTANELDGIDFSGSGVTASADTAPDT